MGVIRDPGFDLLELGAEFYHQLAGFGVCLPPGHHLRLTLFQLQIDDFSRELFDFRIHPSDLGGHLLGLLLGARRFWQSFHLDLDMQDFELRVPGLDVPKVRFAAHFLLEGVEDLADSRFLDFGVAAVVGGVFGE